MTHVKAENSDHETSLRRKFVDRFIPARALLQDPELKRKARLIALFNFCLILFGSFYTAMYAVVYRLPAVSLVIASAVGFTCLLPQIWKRTQNQSLASYQLLTTFFIVLFTVAHTTGGLHSAAIYWFVSLPILASILLSSRHGLSWLCVGGLATIYFFVIERFFGGLVSKIPAEAESTARLVAILGLCTLVYLLSDLSEGEKSTCLTTWNSPKKKPKIKNKPPLKLTKTQSLYSTV